MMWWGCIIGLLHYCATAVRLLRCVGVVAFINLVDLLESHWILG